MHCRSYKDLPKALEKSPGHPCTINRRKEKKIIIHFFFFSIFVSCQLVGGVHKLNEINSLTNLDIISHKVIKMKMFTIV